MFKIIVLTIFIFVNLYSSENSLIRTNKQEIIKLQKQEIEENANRLRYEWISPLSISSSYSKSSTQDDNVLDASINLNQDIFRSGGILYTIEYADVKNQSSLNSLSLEYTSLYKQLYTSLLDMKRLRLTLEQAEFSLKNADIEVYLKTQQYKAGDVDITELNRALREKNSALKSKLSAQQAIVEKEIAIKKLTHKDIDSIQVPKFHLISEDEYKERNYELLASKLDSQLSASSYKRTTSAYLPSLSVNGAYGYTDNPNINFKDDYYSMGLTFSMPLDYNYFSTVQESKVVYLNKKLQVTESQIDIKALYDSSMSKINNYKENQDLTRENITLYTELIDITQKALSSGVKTGYDLETLQNTKEIDELELKISELNIQMELVELIFSTKIGENYYE